MRCGAVRCGRSGSGGAADGRGAGGRGVAGTHYSNIGSVLYFLLRLEPFTKLGVDLQATPFAPTHSCQHAPNALEYPAYCQSTVLQGGAFDHPERLFHSIAQSWQNCLASRTDLKVHLSSRPLAYLRASDGACLVSSRLASAKSGPLPSGALDSGLQTRPGGAAGLVYVRVSIPSRR